MIEKHLGPTIDIHGGGHDLQFPHHENEIAQARCAHHDAPLARFWMHNGFVNVNAEKMSKSIGNVLLVRDLLAQAPGEAIRFALLSAHYRKPLDWNGETLPRACKALDRMYAALEGSPADAGVGVQVPQPVLAALEDDLNTPQAIALLHAMAQGIASLAAGERAQEQARLRAAGVLMGLLQADVGTWADARRSDVHGVDEIERLVREREQARQRKDYAAADRIRAELDARGIVLEDGPTGTQWRKAG
jgi:cysteinyl-tRNA synthetase